MKNNFNLALFGIAAIVYADVALAEQWPQVAAPPRSAVEWVADNVTQNGIPMQVRTFHSAESVDRVLTFYRQAWTRSGGAAIENQLGEWQVIGRREGDFYVTIQVRPINKSESEGFIAVNNLAELLDNRASVDDAFPRMGGSKVVSKTLSTDQGRNATTLIIENTYSVDANASYYVGELNSAGWSLRTRFERPEAGLETRILYFDRADTSCFMTIADTGEGKTFIAVNITAAKR